MAIVKGTHASWLASCPAGDGNFKIHLAQASVTELQEVYDTLPDAGNKTKKKILLREIQKRQSNKTKEGEQNNDNC